MTGAAIGAWLGAVYGVATGVLLAAVAAMALLRQPSRRLCVAWWAVVGLIALLGVGLGTSARGRAVAIRAASPIGEAALLACCGPAGGEGAALPAGAGATWTGRAGAAFAAGAGAAVLWLAAGAVATRRMLGGTVEAPAGLRAALRGVIGPGGRAPRLRIGAGVGQPFAVGVVRPTIVLPARFADGTEPAGRVEAALRHEWAHVRCGDLVLLALLRALLPVLYAHPAYWWLRRRVRSDQEAMADALAVSDGGDRFGYAEALLAWSRAATGADGGWAQRAGSLSLGRGAGELRERVARVLDPGFRMEARCPVRWRLGIAAGAAAVILPLAGLAAAAGVGAVAHRSGAGCPEHAPTMPVAFACPGAGARAEG